MDIKLTEIVEVPATMTEDQNRDKITWRDGLCVALDEGTHITLYLCHHSVSVPDTPAEDGAEAAMRDAVMAYPLRVEKPLTRDMAINAAEMAVYGLKNAMEVASLNASLARKHRADPDDQEVIEHDLFINWVKAELTNIGV